MQYVTLEDTVYFWFASNATSGSGDDGASAVYDVREGGAASDAAPTLSGSATLLSHANYPAGAYEVAIAATAANGFAANKTYGVFCTLAVDSQNPTGFIGSFRTDPIPANVVEVLGSAATPSTMTEETIADEVRVELATELARIDDEISSRMASYTQPTGFLAATFPTDPADQSLIIDATNALATLIGDVPTNAELAIALGTADDATLAAIVAVSKLLRADRKIDKSTNPAHWDEVLLEEGTSTELLRRELFDVDGTALADDETVIGRAIKP